MNQIDRLYPDAIQGLAGSMAVLPMMPFDPVYATAWLSAAAFFLSRWKRLLRYWDLSTRTPSMLALLLLVIHITVSYHWAHDWSHRQAAEHVAQRTEEMIGLRSSLGLYANFGVVIVWAMQLALFSPRTTREPKNKQQVAFLMAEIFLWFMFLNAAIVFAIWPTRVVFIFFAVLVGWDNWANQPSKTSDQINR
ncbi:MAG: hypothetical protein AAGG44_05485 [Planctomycetota bacterium]